MKGVPASALVIVLGATVASSDALAQRLACAAIRSGETATGVARRVTGDAENVYEPWFQILDSTSSRFIAKAQYDHIRPGWQACVINERARSQARRALAGTPAGVWIHSAADTLVRAIAGIDAAFVLWPALVIVISLAWFGIDEYLADRQRMLDAMQRFGDTFIREFERPLIQHNEPDRPIQSRLRASPHRRRLEILLAPNGGRRYPNLSDHKKNVEYDVTRVLQLLRDQPFVRTSLHAQGRWVVVPFELQIGSKQAGAR